jgi:uncharacterized protein with ParB-like and HNH nuclease domain
MSKKISGAEYPLSKMFSSEFAYVIPSYQRPYAWTVDQAAELFDDLHDFYAREPEDTYFLGSVVLIKDEGQPLAEVIDGQQRLTTLTILIAALATLASPTLRQALTRYLIEPGNALEGISAKPRLSLRERDRDLFATYIQGLRLDDLAALDPAQLDNEAQRNIWTNAKLLRARAQEALSSDEAISAFGSFLVRRCFLVAVSTPSQQSAFRVFSILNNRGLDLLPTDIIKADVIGAIPPDRQDEYTEKWEEMEVQAGRSGFSDLFNHIRMLYAKAKPKRTLLEEFREHVLLATPSPESLIDEVLSPFADAYPKRRRRHTLAAGAR